MTAAVLAVGFGFTAEGNFTRAAYLLLFFFCIGYDFQPEGPKGDTAHAGGAIPIAQATLTGWFFDHLALCALIAVAVIHMVERFNWHVVLDRKFPDWLRGT
ncbi:MAG: hypothetical protein JOZ84_05980 [Methylobacteriaceae bacterium]|nr:hypothetical protein [Methylobacteriaceae bacterium]